MRSTAADPAYSHTQVGWWMLAALGAAAVVVLVPLAVMSRGPSGLPPGMSRTIVGGTVGMMALIAILFSTLNVTVSRDVITWRFGPGLIRFSCPLAQVASATPARLTLLAGIGIHFIGSGWVYNVSGRDAVEITKHSGGKLWIGTDQPEALATAIDRARAALASTAAPDR